MTKLPQKAGVLAPARVRGCSTRYSLVIPGLTRDPWIAGRARNDSLGTAMTAVAAITVVAAMAAMMVR